jgi:hypothetical protein
MKTCGGNWCIVPRILSLGDRWRWVVSLPLYHQGKSPPVLIAYEAGWIPELLWTLSGNRISWVAYQRLMPVVRSTKGMKNKSRCRKTATYSFLLSFSPLFCIILLFPFLWMLYFHFSSSALHRGCAVNVLSPGSDASRCYDLWSNFRITYSCKR